MSLSLYRNEFVQGVFLLHMQLRMQLEKLLLVRILADISIQNWFILV